MDTGLGEMGWVCMSQPSYVKSVAGLNTVPFRYFYLRMYRNFKP